MDKGKDKEDKEGDGCLPLIGVGVVLIIISAVVGTLEMSFEESLLKTIIASVVLGGIALVIYLISKNSG